MRSFRFFAALAVLLVPVSAWALSCPSLPVSFVTNTIIQAPDFNSDFIDLYDCLEGALSGYTGAVSNGTSNAQTVTYTNGPSTYSTGTIYSFIVGSGLTNTGAATVNINGLGAKSVEIDGQPLVGGEMAAGTSVALMYDGTALQLLASPGARSPAPNILVNGNVELDQANEGAAVNFTNLSGYGPDEWGDSSSTAASGVTLQQVSWSGSAGVPESLQFSHALQITIGTGSPTINPTDEIAVNALIEGQNLAASAEGTAGARPVALSFCLESNIADAVVPVGFRSSDDTYSYRAYFSTVTLGAAGTPVCVSFVIPGDTGGTWNLGGNSSRGADVIFGLEAGSSEEVATNQWVTPANSTVSGVSGMTQFSQTTGATLTITGVKLEIGPVPTPWYPESFQQELARSERYYQKSYDNKTPPGTPNADGGSVAGYLSYGTIENGAYILLWSPFREAMRCDPTVTIYDPLTGASGHFDINGTASDAGTAFEINSKGFDNIQNLSGTTLTGPFSYDFHFVADCRL